MNFRKTTNSIINALEDLGFNVNSEFIRCVIHQKIVEGYDKEEKPASIVDTATVCPKNFVKCVYCGSVDNSGLKKIYPGRNSHTMTNKGFVAIAIKCDYCSKWFIYKE